ncbi:hypothetical protein D3C87_1511090 [compost metagenome]
MQKLVQPVTLCTAFQGKGIGAFQFLDTRQLMAHVLQVAGIDFGGNRPVLVFQQQRGNAGHRRQVIILVKVLHRGRQRAAHD